MKNLKFLTTSFVIIFVLIVSVAVLLPFGSYVLAYLNSYEKAEGDLLTEEMWNNLDDDFGGISSDCHIVEGLEYAETLTLSCAADEVVVSHSMRRVPESANCEMKHYFGDEIQDERTVFFRLDDADCGIQATLLCCKLD
ncbi:hypothetical protein C0583_02380 [Candidatus Parcubacteria bacterium]|nr:MAG: hypothetical protein C0583_02380 [Candidatus Parcubacteria bacterium]